MAVQTIIPVQSDGDLSLPCESDLSAKQYHFVKLDAAELVVICGANDKSIGVLQNAPDGSSAQATAQVRTFGLTKLKAAETLAMGKFLTPTSTGTAEVCDAANEEFGAKSLGSAAAGDLAACIICYGEVTATDA